MNGSVSWLCSSKLRSPIDQRDVAVAAGQRQRALELVLDDEHPGESVPDVAAGVVEAVVVVPLRRGAFRAAVLDQVVDVGLPRPRLDQVLVAGLARGEAVRDVAVERLRVRGGEAAGLAVVLGAVVAAVEVDRQLADRRRQLVVEGDLGALAGGPADGRPGEGAAVGPHPRRRAGQDPHLGLADRDLQAGAAQLLGDRQPGAKRHRAGAAPRRLGGGRRAARAELEGQQRGEGAAAEGAEECSAPQAWRGMLRPSRRQPAGRTSIEPCIQGWMAHMK